MNPELTALFSKVLRKSSGPLGILAAVGGFLGDVILPLLDLAPWVAGISFLAFVGSVVAFFMFKATPEKELAESLIPASMVLTAGATIIFSIYAVVFNNAPEKGYLAENIEPIAAVQSSLLGLEADVEEIRETTERTEDLVQDVATAQSDTADAVAGVGDAVAESQETLSEIAAAQEAGFAELQQAFANLQAGNVIIEDPSNPQEWYSNARLHQLKGNTAEAIKAYEGYNSYQLEYVDPLQEYVNLLNGTQGIGRARQTITDLYNSQPDNRTLEMMSTLLLDDRDEQLVRLEALANRAPQYAPVFLELGDAYTRQLQATFTTNSREQQSASYQMLFELEKDQQFSSYYIDKSLAQEKLSAAQNSLDSFAAVDSQKLDFMAINSADSFGNMGLLLVILLPEGNVKEILFSLDDPTPSISTGAIDVGSSKIANTNIGPIPFEKGDHTVYIQYTDANDVQSEIFTYEYTVNDIMFDHQQDSFDFSINGTPVYLTLTAIDASVDDLSTWNFSINSDALDIEVQFPGQIFPISIPGEYEGNPQEPLEPGEHTIYAQRTRPDGTKTDVVSYTFVLN
ncbi:MAG: tetratricopeptide repeat protein [Anaerolineae bacterium]